MDKIAITRFKVDKLDYSQYNYTHSKISIKNDLISLIKIKHVIDKNKPQVIHSASPKANLFTIILSKFFKETKFVISFSGLGYLFINHKKRSIFLI